MPTGRFHTGDLVYYNEEGYIFFVDRSKELIKFQGHRVFPTMIENLLLYHPTIREVAVVSIPHETGDEHPVAFVEKKPGHLVSFFSFQTVLRSLKNESICKKNIYTVRSLRRCKVDHFRSFYYS